MFFPYSNISMDNVSLKNHLEVLARGGIRSTGVCFVLLKQLEETPLVATQRSLADMKDVLASLRETMLELEKEKEVLLSNLDKSQERVKQSKTACAIAEGIVKKAEESYTKVFEKKLDLVDEVSKWREKYADLDEVIAQGMDELAKNLKARFRVIAPKVDFSHISPDMVVIDGKIVPVLDEEHTPMPDLKTSGVS